MSANKENNLVQAYIELNKFCQSGDYDRALKATGKGKESKIVIFFKKYAQFFHKRGNKMTTLSSPISPHNYRFIF